MKEYIEKMNSNLLVPSNTLSQSLVVWEHLIGPIYPWHAIIVITYNVGLSGELLTFAWYWDQFNTVFIRNGQHVVFILPLTNNNIITPFQHRFSFLQLLFYNIFGVSLVITTKSSTNVCFLLWKMLGKLHRIAKIVCKHWIFFSQEIFHQFEDNCSSFSQVMGVRLRQTIVDKRA